MIKNKILKSIFREYDIRGIINETLFENTAYLIGRGFCSLNKNLSNIVVNTEVSRSRIRDADMAEESVQLSKSQVLQQAANAMLAQANQSMASVLDLLR